MGKSEQVDVIKFLKVNYLYSFIHLGICVAAISVFTTLAVEEKPDYLYAILAGIATTAYYNLYALLAGKSGNKFQISAKLIFSVTLILLTGVLCLLHFGLGAEILIIGAAGFFVIWYAGIFSKFLPEIHRFPLLRISVISLVFMLLTHTIPLLNRGLAIHEMMISGLSRFCFIASLVIAFDLGGYTFDKEKGNRSLPVLIKQQKSKYVAIALLCLALMADVYLGWNFVLNPEAAASLVMTYFLAMWGVSKANENRSDSYYLFGIDGLMLLPAVIYGLLRFF